MEDRGAGPAANHQRDHFLILVVWQNREIRRFVGRIFGRDGSPTSAKAA
jgi:hypothetical protein